MLAERKGKDLVVYTVKDDYKLIEISVKDCFKWERETESKTKMNELEYKVINILMRQSDF